MAQEQRECSVCFEIYPVEFFNRNGLSPSGKPRRRSACKFCEQKRLTGRRKEDPQVSIILPCVCGDKSRVTIKKAKAKGYHGYMCESCYEQYQIPSQKGNQKEADNASN